MVQWLRLQAPNAGSISGQGTRIPQATGQLSPCITREAFTLQQRPSTAKIKQQTNRNVGIDVEKVNNCRNWVKDIFQILST